MNNLVKNNRITEGVYDKNIFKAVFLAGGSGSGKCLGKGTIILMAKGDIKEVQEIKVGDKVMGIDGTVRNVTSIHKGKDQMFVIRPAEGDSFTCSLGHLLVIKAPKKLSNSEIIRQLNGKENICIISVKNFLLLSAKEQKACKLIKSSGLNFKERKVAIDPYTLGLYLGGVDDIDPKIVHNFEKDKRIPKQYLINSRKTRLLLLGGLVDTLGKVKSNTIELVIESKELVDSVLLLCRSLGLAANKVLNDYKGELEDYTITIKGHIDIIPSRFCKMRIFPRKQAKDVLATTFTLAPIDDNTYYGIELDGDHLHLLGDFTVTHNSFVAKRTTGGHDLKVVNSDDVYERMLNKAGMEMTPDNIFSDQGQEIRGYAKSLSKARHKNFIKGRLGHIIDGTGKDLPKITSQVQKLRALGYDCSMVFVNTNLEVALERNRKRKRVLPDDFVKKAWKDVQENLGGFQKLFGKQNFLVVDNSYATEDDLRQVWKAVAKLINSKVENPIAKKWIANELDKKRKAINGKYAESRRRQEISRLKELRELARRKALKKRNYL